MTREDLNSRIRHHAHVEAAASLGTLEDEQIFSLHQQLCGALDVFREMLLEKGLSPANVDSIMHGIVTTVSFQERVDVE